VHWSVLRHGLVSATIEEAQDGIDEESFISPFTQAGTISFRQPRAFLSGNVVYNNDDTLTGTTLDVDVVAGGVYRVELIAHGSNADPGSGMLKFDFAGSATFTRFGGLWESYSAANAPPVDWETLRVTAPGTDYANSTFTPNGTMAGFYKFEGEMEIDDAGTFSVRASQQTAHASDTTLHAGSILILTKL
jgi:hypothetical protein